jgi:hypothetical protein
VKKKQVGGLFLAKGTFDQFKSEGLHEKHAIETWKPFQRLSECSEKPRKPVSRWQVAGPSRCIGLVTTDKQFDTEKNVIVP